MWFDTSAPPTRDIDLLAFESADGGRIAEVFRVACSLDVPDGVTFDPDTVSTADIRKEAGYPGIRTTMRGELDGTQIHVKVDISSGDGVTSGPTAVTFPVLLDDMPSPVLGAYPKPTVIAEKLEAIVRFGRVNSRPKDCFDRWILVVAADTEPSGLTDEFAEESQSHSHFGLG